MHISRRMSIAFPRKSVKSGGLSIYLLDSSDPVSDAIECRIMPVSVMKVPVSVKRSVRIAGPFGTNPIMRKASYE